MSESELLPCPFCGAKPIRWSKSKMCCETPNCPIRHIPVHDDTWSERNPWRTGTAAAASARRDALEEAAKECDRMAVCYGDDVASATARHDDHAATSSSGAMYAAEIIARRLRALSPQRAAGSEATSTNRTTNQGTDNEQ